MINNPETIEEKLESIRKRNLQSYRIRGMDDAQDDAEMAEIHKDLVTLAWALKRLINPHSD